MLSIVVVSLFVVCQGITASQNFKSVACSTVNKYDCSLVDGKIENAHAYGSFEDDILVSGWGKLWVHGDESLEGSYEAGFLEGALTATRISQHYASWYAYQFPAGPTDSTVQFLYDQYQYTKKLANNSGSEYDRHLQHVVAQFEGVMAGFNYSASKDDVPMKLIDFLLLEAAGDLYDIIPATNPSAMKLKVGQLSARDFEDEWHRVVSCSALIKVTDDLTDVFVGHTTWTSYTAMLRIYKNYDLLGGLYQAQFSSKPGVIYSKDDFYVLPRKDQLMAVMETTNGVMNSELYKLVTPETLLTWQRMPIANAVAKSGKEWTDVFSLHQSGTYCNQYMVVDFKKFTPGKGPEEKDFLWIVEVIPGTAAAQDVTKVLIEQGNYWPSVNIPYTPSIYVTSGYQAAYEAYGDAYSYANCTRAKMFRRDHANVQTLTAMGAEMRQNNYKEDSLSGGDPYAAISSRKDLRTSGASLSGGIDSKVTSYSRLVSRGAGEGTSIAQSGPSHDALDPFTWADHSHDAGAVHLGQPEVFNFPFVEMDFFAH